MGILGNLIPLVILFSFIGAFAWMGYQMYLFSNELADRGKKKLEKKNMTFSKDGMKVGVKELSSEQLADKTQSAFVNTWNNASFPAYKSRLGWNNMPEDSPSNAKPKK